MAEPQHAQVRAQHAYANIDKLADLAGGYQGHPHILGLVHDLRTDIIHLSRQAGWWQDYCRKTGHDPFQPYQQS